MITTTTPYIEGKKIIKYLGFVHGVASVYVTVKYYEDVKDAYERALRESEDTALIRMVDNAKKLGANAIIGINSNYAMVGEKGDMIMVGIYGTAVVVEEDG
ncbi:TPA: YbjQ family protein [Methanocaldococcus jannaschii]|nr:YbjQ family protein [Methanocaldococcus jannaschii]HII59746.1 YbjQ family protein [Methanocaldococcus jannaschii]